MTTLAENLSERHGFGEPRYGAAAGVQVRTAQRTTAAASSSGSATRSTMGSAHAMQTMNPMWLLTALHDWTMEEAYLQDEQRATLRWQLSQGPIPGWLRQHRDAPDEMLSAMLDHVGRRLLESAARRGYKTKPGMGAVGSLDMSTDSPTPEGLPDWAKPANGEHPVRRTGSPRCSFCAQSRDQVRIMTAGPGGVYICNECVAICVEQMGLDDTP
jgi:hypothetical protein